jgi:hypothetical protein
MSDERIQRLERASAETATITHLVSLLMTLDQVGILECQQSDTHPGLNWYCTDIPADDHEVSYLYIRKPQP